MTEKRRGAPRRRMASIKRNFAYNVALNVSRVVFPLITAPYISRVLEPEGIGLCNFASTYAGYFALFALLGMPVYGVREVAKARDDKEALSRLVSELASISFIMTFAVTLVYVSSVFCIGKLDENRAVFLVSGFLLYLAPFRIDWFYSGLEQFGYITLRTVVIRTASVACMFAFVRTKSDLINYVALNVCGTVAGDIWNFAKLLKSGVRPRLTFTGLKKHLPQLFTLFASSVAISVYSTLDTLMLGFMADYRETGFYNNAMHLSKIIIMVVTSLSSVAVPRMSRYCKTREFGKVNELANKSFLIVAFLVIPAAAGMACVAPVFVPLFFGEEFEGAVAPLMILSMLIVSIGFNNLFGVQILVGTGLDRPFLCSVLCGAASNLLLNLMLIPGMGAEGAAIASVAAETIVAGITLWYVYHKTAIRLGGVSDSVKSLCGAFLFPPAFFLMSRHLEGWALVAAFVLCGSGLYVLSQKLLRNKALDLFLPIVLQKMRFKKCVSN